MKKFFKWWKVWGQFWGFILVVVSLTFPFLNSSVISYMHNNDWLFILWLTIFFSEIWWYLWQMRIHGWVLPDDISGTH